MLIDGFFDDVGVSSCVGNLGDFCVQIPGVSWSHRFVCDVASLLVILLVMREEGEEGGADVGDGLLDDLSVVSPVRCEE